MHHNYRTHVLQLLKPNHPRARALQEEPPQWEARAPQESSPRWPQLEKSPSTNKDPAQPEINKHLGGEKRLQIYPVTQSGLDTDTPLQLDKHQEPLVGFEGESAILGWRRGVEKTEAEARIGRDNKESVSHSLG